MFLSLESDEVQFYVQNHSSNVWDSFICIRE